MSVEMVIKNIGGIIALLGFIFGLYQYAKSQRWKKAEFAAKEIEKLSDDKILALACLLLDWQGRNIRAPEGYADVITEKTFRHSWDILEKALTPDLIPSDGNGFTGQEVFYRDTFDYFFTYLERINHFVNINLIETKDVKILTYWLEQIFASPLAGGRPIFTNFLNSFGYSGVFSLANKLNVKIK